MMGKFRDLSGQSFGRWTAKQYLGGGHWECECSCGTLRSVHRGNLVRGTSKSCGCMKSAMMTKHGKSETPEYVVWKGMINRCAGHSDANRRNYSERGIVVCERWQQSFEAFLDDMGPRPSPLHSIERNDNNGPYGPTNCRWATMAEQHRNTRRNHMIIVNGEEMCLKDAANRFGVLDTTILRRLQAGWGETEAATTPSVQGQRNAPQRHGCEVTDFEKKELA
ncbi:MAG: hypothetical protein Kow0026_08380 [Oricola sp.]